MSFWGNFWNVLWVIFWTFAFVSYLFALFSVVADIFRDNKLNGWAKALWVLFLVFVPFLTVLVYLIARGGGMAARSAQSAQRAQAQADEYIRTVAGSSPSDEIAKAKALLDAGTITPEEYAQIKGKALAYA